MELQHETLFLGVSLMDRFLSKGYFESERNLQLLGIASVTLATRLEGVQPGNRCMLQSTYNLIISQFLFYKIKLLFSGCNY